MQAKLCGKNQIYRYRPEEKQNDDILPEVLLVDDDHLNLKYLEGILKPEGYNTRTAQNGSDALYIINNTNVDLVLLDVMMPEMDGFEVCRIIKSNDETRMTPVVLIPALDDK